MGAVTLFVTYDTTKLEFIDVQNNIFGANVNLIPATHTISIGWASSGGVNLNVKFLDLRFKYHGAGGGCGAVTANFADGCELANLATAIIPVNYINGGVNLVKISGLLQYNSDPNPRLPLKNFTVQLKTYPGNLIIGSATTDATTGYYEIWTAPGTYKLGAVEPATYNPNYNWYADMDDVTAMFDYTFGTPIPYVNALRYTAADVTQSGDIDFDDVLAVFDRMYGTKDPNYTLPDWIFEQPTLTINCSDLVNQNFMGLNSGNVLGSNPNP